MPPDFALTLLISLGLTLALELAFALVCGMHGKSALLTVTLANAVTNPAVVLLDRLLILRTSLPRLAVLIFLELAAVITEALIYKGSLRSLRRPLLFSLGANAFSYFCGLFISSFF